MKKIIFLLLLSTSLYSAELEVQATLNQWTEVTDAVYATARDTDLGETAGSSYLAIGQRELGDSYQVFRAHLTFAIPEASAISACTLSLNGSDDNSDNEFVLYVLSAKSALAVLEEEDYSHFDGRQTAGAHDGVNLINTFTIGADYVDEGWNVLTFNAAGLDSLLAYQGSTICLVVISEEDYNNSAPGVGEDEYLTVDALEDEGLEPHLDITYTEPVGYSGTACGINNPANVCGVAKANLGNFIGVE